MARKFGKKIEISKNMNDFMIGIMGPSGFGKTTLMYRTCESLFGPDGYIILDMGLEDGVAALEGVVAEKILDWRKMKEFVSDVVENKGTDYKDLKVVVFDTLDATFEIAESYCIKAYNQENKAKKDFRPAKSINDAWGGYGRGLEKTIEFVKNEIAKLESVGVRVWWTAHIKEKDQSDLFTGNAYTTLTANMFNKYFNSIKNSTHVIGVGYFDRTIEDIEVGEENPVTKKKKSRKNIIDETRKIKFRDDMMIADAKSRFSSIVDEINLSPDEFIKAIMDAIEAEKSGKNDSLCCNTSPKSVDTLPAKTDVTENKVEENTSVVDDDDEYVFDKEEETGEKSNEDYVSEIKAMVSSALKETKLKIRDVMKANNISAISAEADKSVLKEILDLLKEDSKIEEDEDIDL